MTLHHHILNDLLIEQGQYVNKVKLYSERNDKPLELFPLPFCTWIKIISHFDFEDGIWVLVAPVPVHC